MKRYLLIMPILLAALWIVPATKAHAQGPAAVVRAVLFYSPTCPHCQYVISETMLPMIKKYGARLEIIAVDVTQPQGQALFRTALQRFGVAEGGVPFLVIDHTYLMGSQDIPARFPDLIESYLAAGGVAWPDIPGLREAYGLDAPASPSSATLQATPLPAGASPGSASALPAQSLDHATTSHWQDRFLLDPAGNTVAVLVLAVLLASIVWTAALFRTTKGAALREDRAWAVPVLCLAGLAVAGYLSYAETAQVAVVCGPVGDCNTVQRSEYARLFGVLPVGVAGLAGYLAMTITWLLARSASGRWRYSATMLLFSMAVFGTLFSIYLTFLEPFVIGATCAWCLTSAALMTVLMVLMTEPAKLAYRRLARPASPHPPHRAFAATRDHRRR